MLDDRIQQVGSGGVDVVRRLPAASPLLFTTRPVATG